MPRYFFHVHDSVDIIDNEGSDFTDPDAARAEAVVAAGEMLRDVGGRFWKRPEWRLWVTDETGHTICALRFSADGLSSPLRGLLKAGPGADHKLGSARQWPRSCSCEAATDEGIIGGSGRALQNMKVGGVELPRLT